MMSNARTSAPEIAPLSNGEHRPPDVAHLSEEERSKDAFFVKIAEVAEAMIARHGKDFAMGTLVLSARFIAEGKPLLKRKDGSGRNPNVDDPA
jgi:hypothetical protein